MKPIDILRIAFSTFTNNRMRTLLTILGVAIGISSIVFLVSIGYGLQQITIGDIQSIKALTTFDVTTGNSEILALDKNAVESFKKINNVASVNSLLSMSGQVVLDGKKTDALFNNASAEYLDLDDPKMVAGDKYKNDTDADIVVTQVTVNALNIKAADIINKKITANFYMPNPADKQKPTEITKEFMVVGVINDTSASFAYMPTDGLAVPDGINFNSVKVRVDASKNMQSVKEQLIKLGFKTASIGEKIDQMNKIFNIAQIVLLIFGAIALIVASIGMFNTLTISLLERTKDIGIMKALGATDRSIYAIFLAESTIISIAGGLVGIILAMILGAATNVFLSALAARAGGDKVAIFQPPVLFVVIIFAFSIIVGILTGLYPSRRAARLDPLDALRYE
ncbi:MAG: FtsX-like permease family protein [Candidatus Berkelbacteria bacterium]